MDGRPLSPKDSLNRFSIAFAGSAVALCLLRTGLGMPRTEVIDKVYFLTAIAVGVAALWMRFHAIPRLGVAVLGLVGLGAVAIGLKSVERINSQNLYWGGFGPRVAVVAFLLLPFVGHLLAPRLTASKLRRSIAYALLSALALLGALSFLQTRNSLRLVSHSAFVLNEIYAVAAGHFPYTDFIPQYQTLYSYLFAPLIAVLGPERSLTPVLLLLSALSLATVALGVVAGLRATRGLNPVIAPLVILPLVFLTRGFGWRELFEWSDTRAWWADSIAALHSAYPIRMLVPMLIGVVLSGLPVLGVVAWHPRRQLLPLGALLGLGCFHQLDFGLAATLATGAVLLIALPLRVAMKTLALLAGGFAGGFLLVPLLQWLGGQPLHPEKVGWFLRQFGGGFGSVPLRFPGPVLVVLPLLVGATATCLAGLKAGRTVGVASPASTSEGSQPLLDERLGAPSDDYRAALIGSYFGLLALAAFPYYLNRSYASGQLQIMLLPLGITLCAAAQLIAGSERWASERRSVCSLPFRLAVAIPVASVLLLPSPARELARLRSDAVDARWPGATTQALLAIDAWHKLGDPSSVGYLGMDGNFVQAVTGVRNVTRFSSPQDALMSPKAMAELCNGIASPELKVLVLGEQSIDPSACGRKWTRRRSRSGVILARPEVSAPTREPAAPTSVSAPAPGLVAPTSASAPAPPGSAPQLERSVLSARPQ